MVSPSPLYIVTVCTVLCELQATDTGERSKVTLTNWVRLTNAPLLLPRPSAVQWNEYLFLLANNGTTLLYHTKHGIWSTLSRCEAALREGPPPLVPHEGQILTVTTDNSTAHFDFNLGEWKTNYDYLKSQSTKQHKVRLITSTSSNRYEDNQHRGWIGSFKGCLVAIVDPSEHTAKTSYYNVLQRQSKSDWKTICRLSETPLESAAMVGGDLYVLAGGKMFKITIPENEESASQQCTPVQQPATHRNVPVASNYTPYYRETTFPQPASVTKPLFEGSTLHVVKDTLFAFGGRDKDNQPTSDVLRYNPDTDSWESAGYMRSARYNVAMATVQQNDNLDVMAIGGSFGSSQFVMRPRMNPGIPSPAKQLTSQDTCSSEIAPIAGEVPISWENPTSIMEKCVVE